MSDQRARLDGDVADKYSDLSAQCGAPRDWLINHILRTVDVSLVLTADIKAAALVERADKTIILKRSEKKWSAKI